MTKVKTLEEVAYEKIKANIKKGRYLPGSHLTEARLVEDLQMSRTPIRRALVRLETESLLKSESHHGSVVQNIKISMQDVINIYEIRLSYLTSSLTKAKRKQLVYDIQPLKDCLETLELHANEGNYEGYYRTVHDFDKILLSSTNNNLMIDYLSQLMDRFIIGSTSEMFRLRQNNISHTLEQYNQIIASIEHENYDQAIEILEMMTKQGILDLI